MRRAGRTDASDLQVTVNELTPVSEPLGGVRAGCVFGGQLWIRGILKSVAFSALCARKLAELAKLDVLSEVTVGQRLTTNFVVSSGLAKLSRFKLRNRGLQVRVLPGVLNRRAIPRFFWRRDGIDSAPRRECPDHPPAGYEADSSGAAGVIAAERADGLLGPAALRADTLKR